MVFISELVGSLLGSAGIGITFISALNYIYIRSTPENRSFNLSLCHLWFLIGTSITWTLTAVNSLPLVRDKTEYFCGIIATSSILIGILLILNEILSTQNGCDYKSSLDLDVNRENECNQIFHHKNFQITSSKQDSGVVMWSTRSWNPSKQLLSSMGLVLVKIRGLFVYYYPFLVYGISFSFINFNSAIWVTYWFPVIGALIGTIVIRFISAKVLFLASTVLQIIFMVILTVVLEIDISSTFTTSHVVLCLVLITFGLGYSTTDILILDSASLQKSELFLGFGFIIEMGVFGIIQLLVFTNTITFDIDLKPYSIPIIIFMFLSLFIVVLLVPNNFQKPILEIRNTINGFIPFPNPHQNPYQNPNTFNYQNPNVQQLEQPIPRVSRVSKFVPINDDPQCTCTCKCQSNVYPRIPKVDYM